jgi:hypothetical protein
MLNDNTLHLRASDYAVKDVKHSVAAEFIRRHHYSKGCSNTQVFGHGMFDSAGELKGVAMWLPPTRVAAESVDREKWKQVLALTRLAVDDSVPTNGASFLLGRSLRLVRSSKKWLWGVTYADESQGHTGAIYRATNWTYIGRTGPYPRWISRDGVQVAVKATTTRTKAQMEELGHREVGRYYKHKFTIYLGRS